MVLPKPKNMETGEPSWRWRRIMAFMIMGFCFFIVASLGILPEIKDSEVNEVIITSAFWLLGIIFMLYGGFATTQDVAAILAMRSGRPYALPTNSLETKTETKSVVVTPDPAEVKDEAG